MRQIIIESLMTAYNKGFLSLENLVELKSIGIVKSERTVTSMGGKIVYRNNSRQYSITLYIASIKKWFESDRMFNGIKPESLDHAVKLVIEHEVSHIITHYKGGRGHDHTFKNVVKKCFNHKGWSIQ